MNEDFKGKHLDEGEDPAYEAPITPKQYYEFRIQEIENGWLFITELPYKPTVKHFFDSEIEAVLALTLATSKLAELLSKAPF